MHCEWVKVGNITAIVCSSGRKERVKKCSFCHARPGTKLCDYETTPGKTCDRLMCDKCATNVGPDRDHCPNHNRALLPWDKEGSRP